MNNLTRPRRPRGRPREFDRDQALECAMRLFWSRGYESTSISDLTRAMHITPPALYGAFGDKKKLFLEAVERYSEGPGCFARKALTEEATAERAMRRLLLGAVGTFTNRKNPRGCLVVLGATNCALESNDISAALIERRRLAEGNPWGRPSPNRRMAARFHSPANGRGLDSTLRFGASCPASSALCRPSAD